MRGLRTLLPFETVVFVVLFLVLAAIGPTHMLRDPGTFWHLRIGQRILETWTVGRVDTLSFTFSGSPWLSNAWLFDCVQAFFHRLGGFDGVVLAAAASLAALYAWMARRMVDAGLQVPVALLLLCATLAASSHHFLSRPHLATMLLLGLTFARLLDYETGRIRAASLLWIPVFFALWANLHGGVLAGLGSVALACAGWIAWRVVGLPSPVATRADLLLVLALPLLCAAALLVNPFGIGLPRMWLTIVDSPVLPRLIIEHAPVDFASSTGAAFLALGLLYVASLAGVPPRRWRPTWIVVLVWFVLGCTRVRHTPLFAIVAALALASMFREVRWVQSLVDRGSDLLRSRPAAAPAGNGATRLAPALLPALLIGTALLFQATGVRAPILGHGQARLDPSWWPVELLPELRAIEKETPRVPYFHEMLFGGFLIWATPGLPVFIDDRCELYGDQRLREYAAGLAGDTTIFESWDARYGFRYAMTIPGSVYDAQLRARPDWEVVRSTTAATLFRKGPAPATGEP